MPVRASTAPRAALAAAVGLLAASAGVGAAIKDPSKCKAADAGTPGTDTNLVGQAPLTCRRRPGGGRGAAGDCSGSEIGMRTAASRRSLHFT